MAAALRDIPVLVVELSGLGYVERDGVVPVLSFPSGHERAGEPVPHLDPVARVLTAGPVNGARSGPRVTSSGERSLPIRVDPTDLLLPARPGSVGVKTRGAWSGVPGGDPDQVGNLAVATELEFWARDWADARGEGCPLPTVPVLAGWLLDRLDWACASHPALDEFAGKLTHLRTVLTAATGRLPARPEPVDRPCPACHLLMLRRLPDSDYIDCAGCGRVLTDDEYRDHLEDVIKTHWTIVDLDDPRSLPKDGTPVWVRSSEGVRLGRLDRGWWVSLTDLDDEGRQELVDGVSHWAPIVFPADPGPAKEDAA
jgi:hypothetical protein